MISLHDLHDKHGEHVENDEEVSAPSNDVIVPKDSKFTSSKPYTLSLPFPQRMAKAKLDLQFRKFLEVLKKLYISIPFTETLSQIPSYAKFPKEIFLMKES